MPTISPTPVNSVVLEKYIIFVTISSYDGNLDDLVTDFTNELRMVLSYNGIKDASIQIIVNASYAPSDK